MDARCSVEGCERPLRFAPWRTKEPLCQSHEHRRRRYGSPTGGTHVYYAKTPMERFMHYVHHEPMSGCWLWGGASGRTQFGYGAINLSADRKHVLAHRASWELLRSPIPDGLLVLHKCDVPECVNPAHLYLGTKLDNARDMVSRGRHWSQRGSYVPAQRRA